MGHRAIKLRQVADKAASLHARHLGIHRITIWRDAPPQPHPCLAHRFQPGPAQRVFLPKLEVILRKYILILAGLPPIDAVAMVGGTSGRMQPERRARDKLQRITNQFNV